MATAATIDVMLRANTAQYRAAMIDAGRVSNQALGQIRKEAAATAQSIQTFNRVAGGFIGFQGLKTAATELARVADQFQNVQAKVRLAAGDNANLAASFDKIFGVAQRTFNTLEGTAALVQRGSQALQSFGQDADTAFRNSTRLAEVFNKGLVISGASASEAAAAALQFSQALASGRFQGDEFRSVMENNSRFAKLLADSLGVNIAQLRDMSKEGKLTTESFLDLLNKTEALDAEFARMPLTIGRAKSQLDNAFTKFIGEADQAQGASRAIASSISLLAENLDKVATAATLAGGVLASRLLSSGVQRGFSALTAPGRNRLGEAVNASLMADLARDRAREAAATVNQTREAVRLNTAWRSQADAAREVARDQMSVAYAQNEAAQRTLAHQQSAAILSANLKAQREAAATAVAAQRRLSQAQANYNAALASSNVAEQQQIALKGRLIAAQEAATVATNNLAAARAREAAVGRAASLSGALGSAARTVGQGALNLVGGTAGAVVLSVGALAYAYSDLMRKSEDARKEFQSQVDSLDILKVTLDDTVERYRKGSGSIADMAREWNSAGVSMREAEERVKALQAEIANYQARIEQARTSTREGSGLTIGADYAQLEKAQQELAKFQAQLLPTRDKFFQLEAAIKAAVDPKTFEEMRAAALKADDARFEKLLAGLSDVQRQALQAADAIGKIGQEANKDIWSAQLSLLRKTQGDYRGWLAEQGKAYREALGVSTSKEAFAILQRDNPGELSAFRDRAKTMRELEAAEKAWNEQQQANRRTSRAAASESKQQESQYQSITDRITRQIALDKEAMLVNDEMTAAQKLQVVVTNELESSKNKLSETEKARVRVLLDEAVAQGSALKAMEDTKKGAEDLLRLQNQLNESLRTQRAGNEAELFGIGRGGDAVEKMRRLVDIQREYQRQVESLNLQLAAAGGDKASEATRKAYQAQMDALKAYHEEALREEEAFQEARAEMQGDWVNGARKAMEDYVDAAKDVSGQTAEIFGSALSGLEDVFTDFFTKGSADWRGFFDDLHAQITRFIVRQQLSKLVEKFLPGFGQQDQASALTSAAGALSSSAGPLMAAAAALNTSAAALAAAGLSNAAGSSGGSMDSGSTGGTGGSWWGAIASIFSAYSRSGYDTGGYTGPGAKRQPAGVVHKGEVVWSQNDIARAGGVGVVEAMRRGMRGYADGGFVGGSNLIRMNRTPEEGGGRGGRSGRPLQVTNHYYNPNLASKETNMQRAQDDARKLQRATSRNS